LSQRKRRKWLLFVIIGLDWTPQKVYRRYRSRFAIEASYHSLRRVRVKTTSRNPALRFFLLGFVSPPSLAVKDVQSESLVDLCYEHFQNMSPLFHWLRANIVT